MNASGRRAPVPWLLVASGGLLVVLLAWALWGGWAPARRRALALESELGRVYARERVLQERLERATEGLEAASGAARRLELERARLTRRVAELERRLAAARRASPRR